MITISVCMIVKNESNILARCLDSLVTIWDELIIVDTGSTDNTMELAGAYTDKVYEFKWTGDFSEARNFALSKATCDYIYTADADEILEGDNIDRFLALKACLDDTTDVVQMYYGNQLDKGTVYNFDKELRPKLFKRLRPIRFMDPVHETLDLDFKIINTDIVITHKPEGIHSGRDLDIFARMIREGQTISSRLMRFLNRELYLSEDTKQLSEFAPRLQGILSEEGRCEDDIIEACILLARYHRLRGEIPGMFDNVVKVMAAGSNSEICVELGQYYYANKNYDDAAIWFYNAAYETAPVLSIHAGTDIPLNGLADIYDAIGNPALADDYRRKAAEAADITIEDLQSERSSKHA